MRIALAGDTMLGRTVADRLLDVGPAGLFAPEIVEITRDADAFVLNLECCISERGEPWPDPNKPFFFRAPPIAVDVLTLLGVDVVTLANNHALDFGYDALADTVEIVRSAGIRTVGAGRDLTEARSSTVVDIDGTSFEVIGVADHPADFAATDDRPGIAYADLWSGAVPTWLTDAVAAAHARSDVALVTPHWGPNMVPRPLPHVRTAARAFVDAGADLVAGHSAHVFHGLARPVLFDMGDFIDDYAVDPVLRNDLGVFFVVDVDADGLHRVEAIPIFLDYCFTRLAVADEWSWIARRYVEACAEFGTEVTVEDGRLVTTW